MEKYHFLHFLKIHREENGSFFPFRTSESAGTRSQAADMDTIAIDTFFFFFPFFETFYILSISEKGNGIVKQNSDRQGLRCKNQALLGECAHASQGNVPLTNHVLRTNNSLLKHV